MTRATSLLFRPYKLVASSQYTFRSFKPVHIPRSRFNSGTTVSNEHMDHTRPFYSTLAGTILTLITCTVINIGVWKYNSGLDAELAIMRKKNADYEKIKEAILKAEEAWEKGSME